MIKKKDYREKTKRYFDNTALDYDNSGDGKFVQCLYGEIAARAAAVPAKTVLDLGCGNGNIIGILRSRMEAAFYGADISGEMIREARKRLGEEVKLDVADAAELPYDDEMFDLVICNASFHHYTDPVKAVMEIRRVLKKGGTLILGDPTIPGRVFLKLMNWGLHQGNTGDCRTFVFNAVKM